MLKVHTHIYLIIQIFLTTTNQGTFKYVSSVGGNYLVPRIWPHIGHPARFKLTVKPATTASVNRMRKKRTITKAEVAEALILIPMLLEMITTTIIRKCRN